MRRESEVADGFHRRRNRAISRGPGCRAGALDAQAQQVADRSDGDSGHVHGGAGHVHCERGAAAHGGQPGCVAGRGHVGHYQLPCRQRHHPSRVRVPYHVHRSQEVLHVVRGHLRRLVHDVWLGAVPPHPDHVSPAAGGGWRRSWTQRTGHPGRHVRTQAARPGLRSLRSCGGGGSGHRTDARWLDHR